MSQDARRIGIGDVIEIPTAKGFVYAQVSHNHPLLGDVLRILPGYFADPAVDVNALVRGPTRYFVPVAVDVAVRRLGLFRAIDRAALPEHARRFPPVVLTSFKGPNAPLMWKTWDGQEEWLSPTPQHSGRNMPQPSSHSPRLVIDDLEAGMEPRAGEMFLPEPELKFPDLSRDGASGPGVLTAGEARHFLFLRDPATTEAVANQLRASGLRCEIGGRDANDRDWLLVVIEPNLDTASLDSSAARLEALVAEYGGEYDGWETSFASGERTRRRPS